MQKTEKPLSEWTDAELNAIAAERVMGWSVHQRNTACYVAADQRRSFACLFEAFVSDWNPARNPSHSRRVLDAMAERGYGYQIRKYTKASEIVEADVLFRLGPGVWISENKSLDRAICEAAIEALRQEDGNG